MYPVVEVCVVADHYIASDRLVSHEMQLEANALS
jgi:hypothetical protein